MEAVLVEDLEVVDSVVDLVVATVEAEAVKEVD